MSFSGPLSGEVERDVRQLYLSRGVSMHAFYLVGTLIFLTFAVLQREPLFAALGAALPLIWFFVPRLAYRGWWQALEDVTGGQQSGEIDSEGVHVSWMSGRIPLDRFLAMKKNDRCALLYLSKSDAIPIHRSMFENGWNDVVQALEKI